MSTEAKMTGAFYFKNTIAGQEEAERALSIAIGKIKAEHARDGLSGERIVTVLRNALDEEERLLDTARANARSYR